MRQQKLWTGASIGALGAALVFNEWIVASALGRESGSLQPRTTLTIRTLQGFALVIAIAIWTRESWWPVARRMETMALHGVRVGRARAWLGALAPFLIVDAGFFILAGWRDFVTPWSVVTLLALVEKLVIDGSTLALCAVTLAAVLRARQVATVVSVVFGIFVMTDIFAYWFGNTRVELQHFGMLTPTSLATYSPILPCAFLIVGLGASTWTGVRLANLVPETSLRALGIGVALTASLMAIDLPLRYVTISNLYRGPLEVAETETLHSRLRYLRHGSAVQFLMSFGDSTARPRLIDDLTPYSGVIESHHLGLGSDARAPLSTRPFRRVVLILGESLSLDFTRSHNPALSDGLTTFLDSELVQRASLHGHRANDQPTIPGLVATFLSHPNPAMANLTQLPPSLARVLNEAGWRTVLLNSASQRFAGSNILFRNMNFDEQYGRDHFEADPDVAPLVSGWGAPDRVVFDEAIEILEERRDERMFVVVLGCDTHSPAGRRDYSGLEYPDAPEWIKAYPALVDLLHSVFRFDHDLRRFMQSLARRGLYDDETLVIISADHSCPITVDLLELPGVHPSAHGFLPLALLTPQPLPPHPTNQLTTQLDVAPSILHLLGLEIPSGMWGRSFFDPSSEVPVFVGWFRQRMTVGLGAAQRSFPLDRPPTPQDAQLVDLFRGWVGR